MFRNRKIAGHVLRSPSILKFANNAVLVGFVLVRFARAVCENTIDVRAVNVHVHRSALVERSIEDKYRIGYRVRWIVVSIRRVGRIK